MSAVPDARVRVVNDRSARPGDYVLYWMIANRRARSNFALDRAVEHARAVGRGVVVLEALRVDYPWATARSHQFVIDGMADQRVAFDVPGVTYYPYVERRVGEGSGLVERLATEAAVVVTDDYPTFFLPRMVERMAARVPVRVEAVDGNGLVPMRAAGQAFPTAYAFRRYLQGSLAGHLARRPLEHPLADATLATLPRPVVPADVARRWPAWATRGADDDVARLPVDHSVAPVAAFPGGAREGHRRMTAFVDDGLPRYGVDRNDPDVDCTSGLSPYLHFGQVAATDVFDAVMRREGWLGHVPTSGRGARAGWWGVSPAAEDFLDQIVTWREVGFNTCAHLANHDRYESLPAWARATMTKHASDERSPCYSAAQMDAAETYDSLWNAAQRQLRREGRIHNYLRMLWGKKILQWSATPEEALETMIDLNNRYALDGRDPNSYSGIFWTLGRYDRPWGPERPIFGTIRYMSSENTARKVRVKRYLVRYAEQPGLLG
jgi:deoxyribodipyrimidine photo-lyase